MVTDDASIVAPGDCQLEAWTQHTIGQNEYWAVPACNPYGNWELSAGAGHIVPRDGTGGFVEKMLQAKTLFKPVIPNSWGVGLTVANMSRDDAFSGDLSVLVPLSFSLLDDKVLVHLNAGVLRERLTAHRTGSQWAGGAEWAATHDLALTLEAYGTQQGHNYAQTGMGSLSFQTGSTWIWGSVNGSVRMAKNGMSRSASLTQASCATGRGGTCKPLD